MHIYSLVAAELADVEKEIGRLLSHRQPPEVYGMLPEYIRRGGKRLRPALLLLSLKALGADTRVAVPLATVLEIFHNFTLIHDDIMDESTFRRGQPALHRTYGVGIALNSGDALYTMVWNELLKLDLPAGIRERVLRLCGEAFADVVEGQGRELDWYHRRRFDMSEKDYFSMASGKTAKLIGLPCRLGALLAGRSEWEERFQLFGEKIGLAFQIQDDVLNVTGDFKKYKKKIGEDIAEGKRTLLVIQALRQATPAERKRLIAILCARRYRLSSVRYAIRLFEKYGTIQTTRAAALRMVAEARLLLHGLPPGKEKEALLELANFVVSREE